MIGESALAIFAEDYPESESVVAILRRGMKVKELAQEISLYQGNKDSKQE